MPHPRFQQGLVLGKFMPPHHGHRVVISAALAQCTEVTIVVSVLPTDPISADVRVAWLQQLYPATQVVIMPVTWDVTNAQAWAEGVRHSTSTPIDAVFSSEQYGHILADLLDCAHIEVDHDRTMVPISASMIRANPNQYQAYLDPLIWDYFAPKAST